MEDVSEVATAVSFGHGKGKFLLLKRAEDRDVNPGKWDFPSGRIRKNNSADSISEGDDEERGGEDEEPRNAALRELEEETGLRGTLLRSGEPFTVETEDGIFKVHPFLVKVEGEPELSREHQEFKWINQDELEDFDTVGGLREGLERVGALD